ncbi:MAG: nucleotidyltransferase domain-containing protein [Myxococcales bacterium]|nr:nucleotidyltransferase domain-containing protein [Myxococcales bacterium]
MAARLAEVLSKRAEIEEAYLFGSAARGEAQPHSDVDVAVYLDPSRVPDTAFGYDAHLTSELMGVLGTNRVDVVVLNQATPLLYHRVVRDGIRLCARSLERATAREGQALSRYFDWLPQMAKIRAASDRARGEDE